MKYCSKCGTQCEDEQKFCPSCGAPLDGGNVGNQTVNNINVNVNGKPAVGILPRNIAVCIILSIITCGIYGLYWIASVNDQVNALTEEKNATTGGMVILFSIITCGIYELYWMYKMGERTDKLKGVTGSSSILYLILSLIGFSIVPLCLIQDTINKAVTN